MMTYFKRDIALLVVVSIILGTGLAQLIAYGANIYFQRTLISLVGDYGEYDLILQLREDSKAEGEAKLREVIAESLPGGSYKEGPALIGKTSYFIAVPAAKRVQAVYENIDKIFSVVPGISGVSIITEPRLTIRGIPSGTIAAVEEELAAIEGVAFVYRHGSSLGVIMDRIDKIAAVTAAAENVLKERKVLEISFPLGAQPDNPVLTAERITQAISERLQPQAAQYVSVDVDNDDLVHLTSTLQEMKRFLLAYSTKVIFTPAQKQRYSIGDRLVFAGRDSEPMETGGSVTAGRVVVLLTEFRADGTFGGLIVQGNERYLTDNRAFELTDDQVGEYAGSAKVHSPHRQLTEALRQMADLADKLPDLTDSSRRAGQAAMAAVGSYSDNSQRLVTTVEQMDVALNSMNKAVVRLEEANIKGLRREADQLGASLKGLIQTLKLIQLFNPDITAAINNLENTQQKITTFRILLDGMERITDQAAAARDVLASVTADGRQIADALDKIEAAAAQNDLAKLNEQVEGIVKTDFKRLAEDMRTLARQLPLLGDEEVYRSVRLMDKVIEGQILPGRKMQIMVDRNLPRDAVLPVVYEVLGHESVSVFEADLGVIEPNVYLQVYQLLNEVQTVLAGMVSLSLVAVFLAIDHTAVMSAIKSRRLREHGGSRRTLRGRLAWFVQWFAAEEKVYGALMGACLLPVMFYLSGGAIPYVPLYVIPFIGAALGWLVALNTERITPVDQDEVLAGESLGMSFAEIMREIVIPSGRPGLMQWLNRRKLKFK